MPHSITRGSSCCNAECALLNGGTLAIYSGSKPSSPDASIGSSILLTTLTFGSPAFATTATQTAVANAITSAVAVSGGIAGWYRTYTTGAVGVWDGTVGATGAGFDLELPSTTIVYGATVSVNSLTHSVQ